MTAAWRAFLGALAGAMAVLLWHPVSRPYLLGSLPESGQAQLLLTSPALLENVLRLPPPRSLDESALWLEVGAQYEMSGRRLGPSQCETLAAIAARAAEADPDNALWPQCEAAFLALHRPPGDPGPENRWRAAARKLRWDDRASRRLAPLLAGLREEDGRTLAWHFAFAKSRRTADLPRLVARHARTAFERGPGGPDAALDLVRNGQLIRRGARSAAGAAEGARLIQLAAVRSVATPREEALARGYLFDQLSARGRGEDAVWAAAAFAENDAWQVVMAEAEPAAEFRRLATWSLVSLAAPAGLLVSALVGASSLVLGWVAARMRMPARLRSWPVSVAAGSAVGLAVYWAVGLVFPALWAALLVASFGVDADRLKEGEVFESGSGITTSTSILAVVAAGSISLATYGWSKPGVALGGVVAPVVADPALWREVAILTVSIVLFVAPVWGFLNRYPASKVLPIVLRRFGTVLALGSLALTVLVTPAAIALDLRLADHLSKLYLNEPNYYLTR